MNSAFPWLRAFFASKMNDPAIPRNPTLPNAIMPARSPKMVAAGVDRMVVTHAQFEVVNMSFEQEQMKNAASMGAKSNYVRWVH